MNVQQLRLITCIFLSFLFWGVDSVYSQNNPGSEFPVASPGEVCVPGKSPLIITPYFHYGFIIAHHPEMQYLTQGHIRVGELAFTRPTHGEKYWNQLFKFPEPGVALFLFDLGNPQNLGNLYAICPYIDFPFTTGMNTRICFRAGAGMSYLEKPFDPITNYKDVAIGSHFNGFVNFRLTYKQKITERLRADIGISFSHTSNGAFKVPNLGLNMPTLCAGIGYSINPCPSPIKIDTLPACDRKYFWGITVAGAISQISPPGGHYFPAAILSGNIYKQSSLKNLWNLGLECFYNEANYQERVRTDHWVQRQQYLQPAAKVGYALCVGKISMPIEIGFYFYDFVTGEHFPMYEHVGLRYQLTDRLLIGTELKTYFARAEYFEWGVTYRFRRQKCA
jgi:hypothetical protein